MASDIVFRAATRDDAHEIARLFQISSEGVADYIWSQMAEPGESILAVGARRYARENTAFSYQNCLMAEHDGEVVGLMHSYPMTPSGPDDVVTDPVLRPAAELEAPGTLYISSLAIHEPFRGQGIGSVFLALAEERATHRNQWGLSLIAFEENVGATQLYRRHGYEVVDQRTVVPHPLIHATGEALLMVKRLADETARAA